MVAPHRPFSLPSPAEWSAAVVIFLLSCLLAMVPPLERLELQWLDTGFHVLRNHRQPAAADDVVIIGIDEKSLEAFGKPFVLLHGELADALEALAAASPKAVAADLILPLQEFDQLLPGGTKRLAEALLALRSRSALLIGIRMPVPRMKARSERLYAAVAGPDGHASLNVPVDADGAIRRLDAAGAGTDVGAPMLAHAIAGRLGLKATGGIVDFSHGQPFSYVPITEVVRWHKEKNVAKLHDLFSGKVVLVGSIFPDQDRQRMPLSLAAWETGQSATVPGVVFQAQAARSQLYQRMIAESPAAGWLAALIAVAMLLWLRNSVKAAGAVAGIYGAAIMGASVMALAQGIHVPVMPALAALAAGVAAIHLRAYAASRRERARMRSIFAGYVSPAILETILSGALASGLASRRQTLAFLFADIRGFTAYCAARTPEQVIAFLNRYYTAVTPAIHRHGGTVDKFSGDGCMVFFGAPAPSDNPSRDAVLAALGMLDALAALNEELVREGEPQIAIGIGIALGEAIIGNIGSPERHDYAATGAVVTLAAHIQQYCKQVPYALLVEEGAFMRAGLDPENAGSFVSLGPVHIEKQGTVSLVGLADKKGRG